MRVCIGQVEDQEVGHASHSHPRKGTGSTQVRRRHPGGRHRWLPTRATSRRPDRYTDTMHVIHRRDTLLEGCPRWPLTSEVFYPYSLALDPLAHGVGEV